MKLYSKKVRVGFRKRLRELENQNQRTRADVDEISRLKAALVEERMYETIVHTSINYGTKEALKT